MSIRIIAGPERVAAYCDIYQAKKPAYKSLKERGLLVVVYYGAVAGLINDSARLAVGSWRDTPVSTLLREARQNSIAFNKGYYDLARLVSKGDQVDDAACKFIDATYRGVLMPAQVNCQSWEELVRRRDQRWDLERKAARSGELPWHKLEGGSSDPLYHYDYHQVARSDDR